MVVKKLLEIQIQLMVPAYGTQAEKTTMTATQFTK